MFGVDQSPVTYWTGMFPLEVIGQGCTPFRESCNRTTPQITPINSDSDLACETGLWRRWAVNHRSAVG